MATTRVFTQFDLFGGAPTQVVDVPLPPPEPAPVVLEVLPVPEGQLDLMDARSVKLRFVLDALSDGLFDEAEDAAKRLPNESALVADLEWLSARTQALDLDGLATFVATHEAALGELGSADPRHVVRAFERGLQVRVARSLDALSPGSRVQGGLAATWWWRAGRREEALASVGRAKAEPSAACEVRLLFAELHRESDPAAARVALSEAFVIDAAKAYEVVGTWPEVDAIVAELEEMELDPVMPWVALGGYLNGTWPCPPLREVLPSARESDVADAFAKHLSKAQEASGRGTIDVPARKQLAAIASKLFRSFLQSGKA